VAGARRLPLQHHAIERDRIRLMANQISELFGEIPADLPTFSLASQMAQAEAKKYFVESARLRKWQTSGILWWNLLDGWPQFSDAVVDYYFGKKLAYHYIRRAQQPVCVFIGEAGNLGVTGSSAAGNTQISGKFPLPLRGKGIGDGGDCPHRQQRQPADADIHYRAWDADTGQSVAEGDFSLPANQNWQVASIAVTAGRAAAVPDRMGSRRRKIWQPLPVWRPALQPGALPWLAGADRCLTAGVRGGGSGEIAPRSLAEKLALFGD